MLITGNWYYGGESLPGLTGFCIRAVGTKPGLVGHEHLIINTAKHCSGQLRKALAIPGGTLYSNRKASGSLACAVHPSGIELCQWALQTGGQPEDRNRRSAAGHCPHPSCSLAWRRFYYPPPGIVRLY